MNGIEKYCRAVSGALTARRATRRRLTDGLADEIRDALGGECTLEQITAAFGPPEQAAEELQLTVGGAEREGERRPPGKAYRAAAISHTFCAAALPRHPPLLIFKFSVTPVELNNKYLY